MKLQVLPPELMEEKDKIETREPQPYFKPSQLKDGESEEFGCLDAMKQAMPLLAGSMLLKLKMPKLVNYVSMDTL